jgi:hypothetical protein
MQYKSLKESAFLLPQPMEGIITMVNEIVKTIQSDFNLGNDNMKDVV